MRIDDDRKSNKPFISKEIIEKLKKKNIVLSYGSTYDWYYVYIIRPFCWGYLHSWSSIGYIHSCEYRGISLYPYYFRIEKCHDEFIGLIEDITEFEKITVNLKD